MQRKGGREEDVGKGCMETLPQEKKLVYNGPEFPWAFIGWHECNGTQVGSFYLFLVTFVTPFRV